MCDSQHRKHSVAVAVTAAAAVAASLSEAHYSKKMKLSFLSLTLAPYVAAAPDADAVPTLPDFGAPPTPQYSGYLNAKGTADKPGCATSEKECQLHYWFAAAEGDSLSKPVVLWLNGGPGSSSVLGMLQEHGPLLMNQTVVLMVL